MKDYYSILGVDKKASKDEIKKAFRTLAHKYHPDKKTGDDAKFKEVNEAYSVLGNEQKRAQYDQFGSAGPNAGFGGQGFGGFDPSQFAGGFNGAGFEFDLGDIFGDFFGGGRKKPKRGRDISVDIELSFEEAVFGVERVMLLNKTSKCNTCDGTGGEKGTEMISCSVCNGNSSIREMRRTFFGQVETTVTCENCKGKGKMPKNKCKTCHGEGILKRETEIKVKIPAGIENGEMIRLSGAGEAISNGQPGDLYIKIYVKKHPLFRKERNDLLMDLPVKLTDAILGTTETIKTLDGEIKLKIPEGVSHGEILRVKGKGVPNEKGGRGDILIKVSLIIPKKLSKTAKKAVEELRSEGL